MFYCFLLGLPLLSLLAITGCGTTPAAEVLAGDWSLATTESSNLPPTVLNFDEEGTLTKVTFTIDNGTVDYTPTSTSSTVEDSDVTISVTIGPGSLSFVGTLNDDNTLITGNLTTQLVIGSLTINLTGADATLTKQ
jgi:hypothetical protein